MDPKRSTTGSLVDKLVSVCIVLATGLAIVLFVKREGYFPAMSKKAEFSVWMVQRFPVPGTLIPVATLTRESTMMGKPPF